MLSATAWVVTSLLLLCPAVAGLVVLVTDDPPELTRCAWLRRLVSTAVSTLPSGLYVTVVAAEASVVDVFPVREFRCAYNAMPAFRTAIHEALDRRTVSWLTVPTTPVLSSSV